MFYYWQWFCNVIQYRCLFGGYSYPQIASFLVLSGTVFGSLPPPDMIAGNSRIGKEPETQSFSLIGDLNVKRAIKEKALRMRRLFLRLERLIAQSWAVEHWTPHFWGVGSSNLISRTVMTRSLFTGSDKTVVHLWMASVSISVAE